MSSLIPSNLSDRTHGVRYAMTLSILAIAILAVGLYLKPAKETKLAEQQPSPSETQRLRRRAQRSGLESMSEYFASIAEEVHGTLLSIPATGKSAVFWGDSLAIAPGLSGPSPAALKLVTASGESVSATPLLGGPNLPMTTLKLASGVSAIVSDHRLPSRPLDAGSWLLTVWRHGGKTSFATGTFVTLRNIPCREMHAEELVSSTSLSESMSGGGVFDLDGNLLAVVLPCEDRLAALSAASLSRVIATSRTPAQRLLAAYGLRLDPPKESEAAHFGIRGGALVRETWQGYPAAESGLRPGDLIDQADGKTVAAHEVLESLLGASEIDVVLGVRRGRKKKVEVTLSRAQRAADARGYSLLVEDVGGVGVESVLHGASASLASIQPGDRILRIDDAEPRDAAQARRALSRSSAKPVFVEFERGRKRFGLLVD